MTDEGNKTIIRRLYELLTPRERVQTFGLITMMLIGAGLEVVGLSLILSFIHLLNSPGAVQTYPALARAYNLFGFTDSKTFLIWIGLALLFIYVLKNSFFAYFYHLQNSFYCQKKVSRSRELIDMYLRIPYSFYLTRNSSYTVRNLQAAARVVDGVLSPMLIIITETALIVVVSSFLFWMQPLPTLGAAILLGSSAFLVYKGVRAKLNEYSHVQYIHGSEEIKQLLQAFYGLKEVRVLGREEHFISTYLYHFEKNAGASEKINTIGQLPRLLMEVLLVGCVILFVVVALLMNVDLAALVPTLALFALAAFRLMPSLNRVLNSAMAVRTGWNFVNFADDSLRDLRESGWRLDVAKRPDPPPIPFDEQIELQNLTYTYDGARCASVDDVSLAIRKGQSVAFVGHSGAGKTTIIDVILGLLSPQNGKILLDGKDVTQQPVLLQRKIGYIPQQIYLADDTIRRNVAYGMADKDINDEQVWAALRAAQLEEFVRGLPTGLDTTVGERGVRFSGGQRQRVGIARCLYYDREILILDEATSALDNETERAVIDSIEALKGKKTVLIIAHRLSTVARCDRLFFMVGGRVVDSGTYSELAQKNREFAKFSSV